MANNRNAFYPCFACTNGITARCRVRVDDFVLADRPAAQTDCGCADQPAILPSCAEETVIADGGCGYQTAVPACGDIAVPDYGACGCGSSNSGCGNSSNWNGNHWCCGCGGYGNCGSCGGCRLLRSNRDSCSCSW